MNAKKAQLFALLAFILCPMSLAYAAVSGTNLLTNQPIEVKPGEKGTVVVFLSATCPCSNSHVNLLKELSNEYQDFSFVAVHSNSDESTQVATSYFKDLTLPFPVIQDHRGILADEFKALKTPHAFLIGPEGKILYKGGVTNSTLGQNASKHYLRDALADVKAGRKINISASRTLGCAISRRR